MSKGISRRNFLKAGALAAATLAMPNFLARSGGSLKALAAETPPDFNSALDVYRKAWTWDKTVPRHPHDQLLVSGSLRV